MCHWRLVRQCRTLDSRTGERSRTQQATARALSSTEHAALGAASLVLKPGDISACAGTASLLGIAALLSMGTRRSVALCLVATVAGVVDVLFVAAMFGHVHVAARLMFFTGLAAALAVIPLAFALRRHGELAREALSPAPVIFLAGIAAYWVFYSMRAFTCGMSSRTGASRPRTSCSRITSRTRTARFSSRTILPARRCSTTSSRSIAPTANAWSTGRSSCSSWRRLRSCCAGTSARRPAAPHARRRGNAPSALGRRMLVSLHLCRPHPECLLRRHPLCVPRVRGSGKGPAVSHPGRLHAPAHQEIRRVPRHRLRCGHPHRRVSPPHRREPRVFLRSGGVRRCPPPPDDALSQAAYRP